MLAFVILGNVPQLQGLLERQSAEIAHKLPPLVLLNERVGMSKCLLAKRVAAWLCALAFAVLALVAFHPNVRPIFLLVIFVAMWVLFRIVWGWVFFQRRAELDKKIPVSSKELRKRKKKFFDSLQRP